MTKTGLDQEGYLANSLVHYATMHNIVLIGGAATHIPDEIRNARPDIPLVRIIGARNRIIHGYLTVDDDIVWDIIQKAIPSLLPRLRELLETAQYS